MNSSVSIRPKLQPPLLVSLRRFQIASLTATAVDFSCLALLVQFARTWYVVATAMGAALGASVNFTLGRHWSFTATDEAVRGQAIRYAAVSTLSLVLNSLGVYALTEFLKIHYAISRAIIGVLVAVVVNFPLHRRFVFGKNIYA